MGTVLFLFYTILLFKIGTYFEKQSFIVYYNFFQEITFSDLSIEKAINFT